MDSSLAWACMQCTRCGCIFPTAHLPPISGGITDAKITSYRKRVTGNVTTCQRPGCGGLAGQTEIFLALKQYVKENFDEGSKLNELDLARAKLAMKADTEGKNEKSSKRLQTVFSSLGIIDPAILGLMKLTKELGWPLGLVCFALVCALSAKLSGANAPVSEMFGDHLLRLLERLVDTVSDQAS